LITTASKKGCFISSILVEKEIDLLVGLPLEIKMTELESARCC